jgi:hypothetical protein
MADWTTISGTVESLVTAGGIVAGGIFTYYKFAKDRIYRPRVDLGLAGRIIEYDDGRRTLTCTVTVHNMGATKLELHHAGTAVIVRPVDLGDPMTKPTIGGLDDAIVMDVFARHDWLESTETIREDVVARAADDLSAVYRVELRLIITNPKPTSRDNIELNTACVLTCVPPEDDPGMPDPSDDPDPLANQRGAHQ